MKRKQPVTLFGLIRRVMHTYSSCHLSRSAAAVAYDLLLALFPMIVCFSVLLYRRVPVAATIGGEVLEFMLGENFYPDMVDQGLYYGKLTLGE